MSFLRSTMVTRPWSSITPISPVRKKPSFGHHLGGLVGTPPIAGHHLRPARADFAAHARRQVLARVVADGDVGRGQRQADGAGPFGDIAAIAGEHRRGLRQTVAFDDRTAGGFEPGIGDGFLHRHAAADGVFEHAPIDLAEVGMVQQRVEQGVHRRKGVHFVSDEHFDKRRDIARIGYQQATGAGAHAEQEARGQREDVIERQRGEDRRLLDRRRRRQQRRVPGFHLQDIGDQITVQQHRALGDAGGAAGILQEGDIVGPDGGWRERQRAALLERLS